MVLGLAAAFLVTPAQMWARRHEDIAKLIEEIQRQKNPVKKAKLEIRLARTELQQMVEAYDHNEVNRGQRLLETYLEDVNESWNLLKNSGRNAAKNPSGFMQLEIALRENARVLADLRDRVAYINQGPISKTLGAINQLHSRVLLALFPGAAPHGAAAQKPPIPGARSLISAESQT